MKPYFGNVALVNRHEPQDSDWLQNSRAEVRGEAVLCFRLIKIHGENSECGSDPPL